MNIAVKVKAVLVNCIGVIITHTSPLAGLFLWIFMVSWSFLFFHWFDIGMDKLGLLPGHYMVVIVNEVFWKDKLKRFCMLMLMSISVYVWLCTYNVSAPPITRAPPTRPPVSGSVNDLSFLVAFGTSVWNTIFMNTKSHQKKHIKVLSNMKSPYVKLVLHLEHQVIWVFLNLYWSDIHHFCVNQVLVIDSMFPDKWDPLNLVFIWCGFFCTCLSGMSFNISDSDYTCKQQCLAISYFKQFARGIKWYVSLLNLG